MKRYTLHPTPHTLHPVLYTLTLLFMVAFLSGCGSQYLAERLFWQAQQVTKKITQGSALDKLSNEDYQKIIDAFGKVSEKYPLAMTAAQSQFIVAQLYVMRNDFSEAEKELIKVTRNFSGAPEIASRAQFLIGNIYERQGKWEAAVSEYEKLIDLYPLSRLGLKMPIYIAQHYQLSKDASEAEKAYTKAVRGYEGLIGDYFGTSIAPVVMDHLALAYLSQGKWDEAIEVWQEITTKYSQSPLAEKSMLASGEIYSRQIRDLQKAIQTYEEFVNQYPRSQLIKQVRLQIGKLYFTNGDTEKAKQIFEQIISDYPQEKGLCADARFSLAACYEREADSQNAIEQYNKLKNNYPDTRLALAVPFFIARHYLITQPDKAEAAFSKAIYEYKDIIESNASIPIKMEAGKLINFCYAQQKKWDEAIVSLYELIAKYPDNPQAQMFLFDIGNIYERELNEPEKASAIYKELISKYPSNHFLINLARMRLESLQANLSKDQNIEN